MPTCLLTIIHQTCVLYDQICLYSKSMKTPPPISLFSDVIYKFKSECTKLDLCLLTNRQIYYIIEFIYSWKTVQLQSCNCWLKNIFVCVFLTHYWFTNKKKNELQTIWDYSRLRTDLFSQASLGFLESLVSQVRIVLEPQLHYKTSD